MPDAPRLTALAIAEGLHLAYAAAALRSLGIFEAMQTKVSAKVLARQNRIDPEMLAGVLAYLAARTDLVAASGDGYALGGGYDSQARFVIDLYARAFAPVAADITATLRRPGSAGTKMDRRAQSDAFADDYGGGPLTAILRQLEFNQFLDLGCGNASLLRALAVADPGVAGVGIDASPVMCRTGRRRARAAGVARRVRIVQGDARYPERVIDAHDRKRVETILARDFVNELCRDGGKAAVAWLRRIRRLFPGCVLVIADYYGCLGSAQPPGHPHILLHDFVQVISGQGIPPGDLDGWCAFYEAADCRLAHVIEDDDSTRFVHFLKL